MSRGIIFCPGGRISQTGTAASERYASVTIENCGKIPQVPLLLDSNPGPYVVPIWNSHQGEVKAADYVWNLVESGEVRISDIWAKKIEFWYVSRDSAATSYNKIGSVVVANTQCSGFLLKKGAALEAYDLTTTAFEEYRKGALLDGVLVAPGQGVNDPGYRVLEKATANPNNFTSFVRLVATRAFTSVGVPSDQRPWFTGVTLRPLNMSLGEGEQSFFARILENVRNVAEIPRLIFVVKRTAKVGLLFEGSRLQVGDLLDAEEMERGDISVFQDVGTADELYTEGLQNLFTGEFEALKGSDFILHLGISACLFACPPLRLYTHGYEVQSVEPVVRFYVSKLFELWDDGDLTCNADEEAFFRRHEQAWRERRSEFIDFTKVDAEKPN
jgi:hypothetical protein